MTTVMTGSQGHADDNNNDIGQPVPARRRWRRRRAANATRGRQQQQRTPQCHTRTTTITTGRQDQCHRQHLPSQREVRLPSVPPPAVSQPSAPMPAVSQLSEPAPAVSWHPHYLQPPEHSECQHQSLSRLHHPQPPALALSPSTPAPPVSQPSAPSPAARC